MSERWMVALGVTCLLVAVVGALWLLSLVSLLAAALLGCFFLGVLGWLILEASV